MAVNQDLTLAALISSRICHDLISPVGAISNGLELLNMSGMKETEELSLIADSVKTAAANLKFMRIAFGAGSTTEAFSAKVLSDISTEYFASPRLTVTWMDEAATVTRDEAKMIFLLSLIAVSALPLGGTLRLSGYGAERMAIVAELESRRVALDEASQDVINGSISVVDADPRQAPLALLVAIAQERGMTLGVELEETGGRIMLNA